MSAVDRPGPSPYDPFQPRRGRAVALGAGVVSLVLFCVLAALVPGGARGFGAVDRLMLVGCGVAIAAVLARYAAIRAIPDESGLTVRNLMTTRHLPWTSIEAVRFGHGDPWVSVVLDDTETVAVMAIQRADGLGSQTQAGRLAALVESHRPRRGEDDRLREV